MVQSLRVPNINLLKKGLKVQQNLYSIDGNSKTVILFCQKASIVKTVTYNGGLRWVLCWCDPGTKSLLRIHGFSGLRTGQSQTSQNSKHGRSAYSKGNESG